MEAQGKPAHAEADQAKSENIGGSMNRQGEISTARVSETGEGSSSRRSSSSGSSCSSEDSIPESDCDGTSIFQLLRESKQAPALRRLQRTPPELPPDAVDPGSGWALLHFTGYYGLHELAEFLVQNGAPLNPRNAQLETPLHMCAKWPHERVADVLCTAGADVNAQNRRDRTPAHLAALYMRKGVLERLIAAGADLNIQDSAGDTPAHIAARPGNSANDLDVLRTILRTRCRVDLVNKQGQTVVDIMENPQYHVCFASSEGLAELMEGLVRKGAKVDIVDGDGMTPLQLAAFRSDLTMVKTLLAAGAKVNYQVPTAWMPTLGALEPQHGDPVALYGKGRPPLGDRSPLHFAAERGGPVILEALIAAGAKVNNTQNEGLISPLHIAVWNQQIDSVRTLLNHKADVRARVNKNGMAALHFACNAPNAKPEIIKMLLDAKADIEERCADGWTPLMLAAQMASPACVRLLLDRGARLQAQGRKGITALGCAEGRPDVLEVMLAHCEAKGLPALATKASAALNRAKRMVASLPPPLVPQSAGAVGAGGGRLSAWGSGVRISGTLEAGEGDGQEGESEQSSTRGTSSTSSTSRLARPTSITLTLPYNSYGVQTLLGSLLSAGAGSNLLAAAGAAGANGGAGARGASRLLSSASSSTATGTARARVLLDGTWDAAATTRAAGYICTRPAFSTKKEAHCCYRPQAEPGKSFVAGPPEDGAQCKQQGANAVVAAGDRRYVVLCSRGCILDLHTNCYPAFEEHVLEEQKLKIGKKFGPGEVPRCVKKGCMGYVCEVVRVTPDDVWPVAEITPAGIKSLPDSAFPENANIPAKGSKDSTAAEGSGAGASSSITVTSVSTSAGGSLASSVSSWNLLTPDMQAVMRQLANNPALMRLMAGGGATPPPAGTSSGGGGTGRRRKAADNSAAGSAAAANGSESSLAAAAAAARSQKRKGSAAKAAGDGAGAAAAVSSTTADSESSAPAQGGQESTSAGQAAVGAQASQQQKGSSTDSADMASTSGAAAAASSTASSAGKQGAAAAASSSKRDVTPDPAEQELKYEILEELLHKEEDRKARARKEAEQAAKARRNAQAEKEWQRKMARLKAEQEQESEAKARAAQEEAARQARIASERREREAREAKARSDAQREMEEDLALQIMLAEEESLKQHHREQQKQGGATESSATQRSSSSTGAGAASKAGTKASKGGSVGPGQQGAGSQAASSAASTSGARKQAAQTPSTSQGVTAAKSDTVPAGMEEDRAQQLAAKRALAAQVVAEKMRQRAASATAATTSNGGSSSTATMRVDASAAASKGVSAWGTATPAAVNSSLPTGASISDGNEFPALGGGAAGAAPPPSPALSAVSTAPAASNPAGSASIVGGEVLSTTVVPAAASAGGPFRVPSLVPVPRPVSAADNPAPPGGVEALRQQLTQQVEQRRQNGFSAGASPPDDAFLASFDLDGLLADDDDHGRKSSAAARASGLSAAPAGAVRAPSPGLPPAQHQQGLSLPVLMPGLQQPAGVAPAVSSFSRTNSGSGAGLPYPPAAAVPAAGLQQIAAGTPAVSAGAGAPGHVAALFPGIASASAAGPARLLGTLPFTALSNPMVALPQPASTAMSAGPAGVPAGSGGGTVLQLHPAGQAVPSSSSFFSQQPPGTTTPPVVSPQPPALPQSILGVLGPQPSPAPAHSVPAMVPIPVSSASGAGISQAGATPAQAATAAPAVGAGVAPPVHTAPAPAGAAVTAGAAELLQAALQGLQAPPGLTSNHLLLSCSDITLLAQTPGMLEAWLKGHVGPHGALSAYRILPQYGAVALSLTSPQSAGTAQAALNGSKMLMSTVAVTPLSEFPDNMVLATHAQQVAARLLGMGTPGFLESYLHCWQLLNTLPSPVTSG